MNPHPQHRPRPPDSHIDRYHRLNSKDFLLTLLLCFFFGIFGVHRFYVGKVFTGFLMLLTFGGLGIWALVDLILIICCRFRDRRGRRIVVPASWIKIEVGRR